MNEEENDLNQASGYRFALQKQLSEKSELISKITMASHEYHTLTDIRKQILNIKQSIRDEEKSFQKETLSLKKKIIKLSTKISETELKTEAKIGLNLNSVKLTTLQVSYKASVDKLYKVDQKLADFKEQSKDIIYFNQEIDKKIENLEEYCNKMEGIMSNLIPLPQILLQIADLESEVSTLKDHIKFVKHQIPARKMTIEELKTSISIMTQKLDDILNEEEAPLAEVMPDLYKVKIDELNQIIQKIREINQENEELKLNSSNYKIQTKEIFQNNEKEKNDLLSKNESLQHLCRNLENQINSHKGNAQMQIVKMKQLEIQLLQKIKKKQKEILKERAENPDLKDLSVVLEKKWSEHQLALDTYMKGKDKLEKDRVILDHKIRVIKDLNEWCPISAKVKTNPGIEEFMLVYDRVFTQNRDMANDLQLLSREKSDLEGEKKQLLRKWSNLEK
ncbi:hypothetical protein TRFO_05773 [Tritrichomonas foetus]|uniref:Uncharacterized protein n=1 Tax=Tritrichomonas foetus TaxID=1144522 RepID=A0A1J4K2P9_9EUKA|nr:hypothetical protein TRFO_05773 [Tritrichomonas foetus]|eukprot:OHT05663.1 hypothetical protein TRFO_05773 [Tritrichomonas foetus]